jgi:type I restriction enzyme S subunit
MSTLKPYPDYKDIGVEWLEKVPRTWEVGSMRHALAEVFNGSTATQSTSTLAESVVMVTRIETISGGSVDYGRVGLAPESDVAPRYRLVAGDVLYSNINSLAMVGNCAQYDGDKALYAGMNLLTLRFKDGFDRRFGYWLCSSTVLREQSRAFANPAINQASISRSNLRGLRIPLPPRQEQRAIASFLDRETAEIDAFIEDQQELIGLLNERRAATITQAVTKGLDPTAPMKDSGVEWSGELPAHWMRTKLAWVFSFHNGDRGSEYPSRDEMVGEGIPFINAGHLVGGRVDHAAMNFITEEKYERLGGAKLKDKDILYCLRGSLGKNALFEGERGALASSLVAMRSRSDDSMIPAFAWWALNSPIEETQRKVMESGSAQPNLSVDDIRTIVVPLPPIDEQKQIADFLDRETVEIDAAIADAKEAIELSKERRAALISAAVTGKIDVRDHPAVKGAA